MDPCRDHAPTSASRISELIRAVRALLRAPRQLLDLTARRRQSTPALAVAAEVSESRVLLSSQELEGFSGQDAFPGDARTLLIPNAPEEAESSFFQESETGSIVGLPTGSSDFGQENPGDIHSENSSDQQGLNNDAAFDDSELPGGSTAGSVTWDFGFEGSRVSSDLRSPPAPLSPALLPNAPSEFEPTHQNVTVRSQTDITLRVTDDRQMTGPSGIQPFGSRFVTGSESGGKQDRGTIPRIAVGAGNAVTDRQGKLQRESGEIVREVSFVSSDWLSVLDEFWTRTDSAGVSPGLPVAESVGATSAGMNSKWLLTSTLATDRLSFQRDRDFEVRQSVAAEIPVAGHRRTKIVQTDRRIVLQAADNPGISDPAARTASTQQSVVERLKFDQAPRGPPDGWGSDRLGTFTDIPIRLHRLRYSIAPRGPSLIGNPHDCCQDESFAGPG